MALTANPLPPFLGKLFLFISRNGQYICSYNVGRCIHHDYLQALQRIQDASRCVQSSWECQAREGNAGEDIRHWKVRVGSS